MLIIHFEPREVHEGRTQHFNGQKKHVQTAGTIIIKRSTPIYSVTKLIVKDPESFVY